MWSESPCHQCTGTCDVGGLEAPGAGEQDDVGEHGARRASGEPLSRSSRNIARNSGRASSSLSPARLDGGVGVQDRSRRTAGPAGSRWASTNAERQPGPCDSTGAAYGASVDQPARDGVGPLWSAPLPRAPRPRAPGRAARRRQPARRDRRRRVRSRRRVSMSSTSHSSDQVTGPVEDVVVEVRRRGADARDGRCR